MNKIIAVAYFIFLMLSTGQAEICNIDEIAEKEWFNYTLPLPHEITINARNILSPANIGVKLSPEAGDIEKNAVSELKQFFIEKTGTGLSGTEFIILVGIPDTNGKIDKIEVNNINRLKNLPNHDQSYIIQSMGENKLVIAALNPKGIYYGLQTLRQLLMKNINSDSVAIPLVSITDWPDLSERGSWCGSFDNESVLWYSQFKLNFHNHSPIDTFNFIRNITGSPEWAIKVNGKDLELARQHAFNRLSISSHFNFEIWYRFYQNYYPELIGKGERSYQKANGQPANNKTFRCPCASNPLFEDVLASKMLAAAAAGIKEQSFWTTEFWGQCECDKCKNENQYVLETRALLRALRRVQEKYPDYKIRIAYSISKLHSDGTICRELPADTMEKVVAILPPDVDVERACFALKSKEGKYIDPPFDQLTDKGNKLFSYRLPTLGRNTLCSYGSDSQKVISDILERKWHGGYAFRYLSENKINSGSYLAFQLAAIAEWGWNNKGRDIRQFAIAWATVNQYSHPIKFGDLIEIIAPFANNLRLNFVSQQNNIKNAFLGKIAWPFSINGENMPKLHNALRLAKEINQPRWILEVETIVANLKVNSATGKLIELAMNNNDKTQIAAAFEAFKNSVIKMEGIFQERDRLYQIKDPRFNELPLSSLNAFAREVDNQIKPLLKNKFKNY